jgi:hypothetical protein
MLDVSLQGLGFCRCVCANIGLENISSPSVKRPNRQSLAFTGTSVGVTFASSQAKTHSSGAMYEKVLLLRGDYFEEPLTVNLYLALGGKRLVGNTAKFLESGVLGEVPFTDQKRRPRKQRRHKSVVLTMVNCGKT